MHTPGSEQMRVADRTNAVPVVEKENRRIQRISLPLPVRIEVKIDAKVSWNEITRLSDISAFGAGFTLKRPVKRGRLVLLTIPMPRQLRCFDYSEPQYKIWALVRRCIETGQVRAEPSYAIGVAFTGQRPPIDYSEHPSRLYDISHREQEGEGFWHLTPADLMADDSDLPKDLRKQTRFFIPESLKLEILDDAGNVTASETTVTENLSLGGAAVFTQFELDPGSFLRVTSERFDVTIISVVRGKRVGPDGITRLHLEFIDRHFPLQGID
ncbi:MAG: PilZ domain-containing protein [Acidobacteria bacterium]|nr:PilZ domain-containing protein [Acidobacteriota bacterium]